MRQLLQGGRIQRYVIGIGSSHGIDCDVGIRGGLGKRGDSRRPGKQDRMHNSQVILRSHSLSAFSRHPSGSDASQQIFGAWPLHAALPADLNAPERLFADETTAPALDPGRERTKTG